MATEFKDLITKQVYRVPSSQLKAYQLYRSRYVVALSMAVLLHQLNVHLYLTLGLSILFMAISEFRYRTHFLKHCQIPKKPTLTSKPLRSKTMLLNLLLYLILGVLLAYFGMTSPNIDNPTIIYLIAAVAMGIAFSYGYKYLNAGKDDPGR